MTTSTRPPPAPTPNKDGAFSTILNGIVNAGTNDTDTGQHVVSGLVHVRGSVCETQPPYVRHSLRLGVPHADGSEAELANQLAPLASATEVIEAPW